MWPDAGNDAFLAASSSPADCQQGVAGRIVGGYRLGRQLGGRGAAVVHVAQDRRGRRVALKVVHRGRSPGDASWRWFAAECAFVSAVRDQHVVRAYEHRVVHDVAYLAMEYLPGGTLGDHLHGGIAPEHALSLLRQAAGGLAAAHRCGIVHRDVKPRNLLLREGQLVLADFGVAARAGDASARAGAGRLVGTACYAAPEQAQGAAPQPQADVYSLGVLFHEMLCGQPPFSGRTATELLAQHLVAPVPRLPRPLGAWQGLVDRLLAKQPQHRPADADGVLQEIQRLAHWHGLGSD
ncbi:MAG TPA: serine/threonine-protein kinase [Ramlibacter sp.]